MQTVKFYKKYENLILALVALIGMMLFVGLKFDYYYQANDDIYIKNILSGAYTGTPEGHNIQMHYPISLLISVLYRIAGNLPIYGLFLCACHYGAAFLIFERSARLVQRTRNKVIVVVLEAVIFTGLLMAELVIMQYTVTCTLLAAAATFRFYTTDKGLGVKAFVKSNILNVILVTLAFLIRSEMLLLLLPMICTAGVFKWFAEKPVFTKENASKYFCVFGLILAGLGVGQLTHMIAYSNEEWTAFDRFFKDRTELYDYQYIPEYAGNEDFYDEIGLLQSEQELLVNYNFGLDEDIDADILRQTAEYAAGLKADERSFFDNLKDSLYAYKYKFTGEVDYPWNVFIWLSYGLLILIAWKNKSYMYIWKVPFLFFIRTGLWMYIIMGNRYPVRITHSLYFMELAILAALIFEECRKEYSEGQKKYEASPALIKAWQSCSFSILVVAAFGILGISCFEYHVEMVTAESELRDYANREIIALEEYCESNPDSFYFIDVYSSVSCTDYVMSNSAIEYSEKAFKDVDNSLDNYDLMGGWVVKSPLTARKLANFDMKETDGISAMERGIVDAEDVYVIIKTTRSPEWIVSYYNEKVGIDVTVSQVDEIKLQGKPIFIVYQVKNYGNM